jgi:hypothetical protein
MLMRGVGNLCKLREKGIYAGNSAATVANDHRGCERAEKI